MSPCEDKVRPLASIISEDIHDGDQVVIGANHEALIPFAAVYELIRQGKRNLTAIAPISDIAIDMMVGAGLLARVVTAWAGNVTGGLGHAYRRAAEKGIPRPLEIVDHSNYSLALALLAASMDVPFLPTRTLLGTDIVRGRAGLEPLVWHGIPLVAVPALKPDVAIVAVQRADREGNCRIDGPTGMVREAAMAARKVVVVAEDVVNTSIMQEMSDRLTLPGMMVSRVAHVPYGAHPSPVLGYYGRDTAFFQEYHQRTRTLEGFQNWLADWVYGPQDHHGYLRRLGSRRLEALRNDKGVWQWDSPPAPAAP